MQNSQVEIYAEEMVKTYLVHKHGHDALDKLMPATPHWTVSSQKKRQAQALINLRMRKRQAELKRNLLSKTTNRLKRKKLAIDGWNAFKGRLSELMQKGLL